MLKCSVKIRILPLLQGTKRCILHFLHFTAGYTAIAAKSEFCTLHCSIHFNISRWSIQSRYCRDSHPDQGCTKHVQSGNVSLPFGLWSDMAFFTWVVELISIRVYSKEFSARAALRVVKILYCTRVSKHSYSSSVKKAMSEETPNSSNVITVLRLQIRQKS